MKKKKMLFGMIAIIVILFQSGCGLIGGAPQTQAVPPANDVDIQVAVSMGLTQTAQAAPAVPAVPVDPTAPPIVLPTNTVEVPTEAPVQAVQGTVNYGANCRSGPGGNFPNVTIIGEGTLVDIIGTNKNTSSGTWWQVSSSGNEDCWLIDEALVISGDTSSVAQVESPPTPTPAPPASLWAGIWNVWVNYCFDNDPSCEFTFTMNWTMTGYNTITGSYGEGGCTYTDVLTVDPDGMRATGRETSNGCGNYDVTLYMNSNQTQFSGHWNFVGAGSYDGYFCGARAGYGKPGTCKR